MAKLVTWNCNGLSDSTKINLLRTNFSDLKRVDFTLLIETHLSDSDGVTDELRDLQITHEVTQFSEPFRHACRIMFHNFKKLFSD